MSLVVFEDVSLSYGKKTILDGLSLAIAQGDRIGLVGPNGSGKTTILRLTAGEQEVDHGQVRTGNDVRLGYLPQDLQLEGGRTLREFLRESIPGRTELDRQVAETEAKLRAATEAGNEETTLAVAERLAVLHERQTYYELHYTEHEALRILAGLGFETTDHDRDLTEFSGGWKMRAVLAGLLFQKPDLLLLDEPTNHLDLPSVAWFAGFLKRYSGAFVLICHDREFMNEQISRVVTFEPEGVRQYTGNYESYLKQRAEESEILENRAKNLAKQREAAEKFITRFRAKASKASAVQSRVKMLEKMDVVEVHQDRRAMRFSFPKAVRAGEEVVKVRELSKSYGDLSVFERVDLTVRRGERIGIIGKNGAGKTTLLKVIARELDATGGEVDLGHNVKVSYYAQHHAEVLDRNRTIYEEVYGHSKDAGVTRVRTLLGAFLFSGDDVDKYIKVLSGGERARVALAKMLVDPGNVILMDEPTNHL
ncbi:MAG: ABC-F family ATP-binding cassette domain-containing protein, partial [Myxococcota bacterium]